MKCFQSVHFFDRQVIRVLQFREATHLFDTIGRLVDVVSIRCHNPPPEGIEARPKHFAFYFLQIVHSGGPGHGFQ